MTLHLTRDEADRLTADGRVVLFREGGALDAARYATLQTSEPPGPPAEFVEAAKPCETCEGIGKLGHESWHTWTCPDCLNGKRRVAAVVRCTRCRGLGVYGNRHNCEDCRASGLVTVGYVVVEWGPLVVQQFSTFKAPSGLYLTEKLGALGHRLYLIAKTGVQPITLPPDIDPQSLVGQYALGIEAAS